MKNKIRVPIVGKGCHNMCIRKLQQQKRMILHAQNQDSLLDSMMKDIVASNPSMSEEGLTRMIECVNKVEREDLRRACKKVVTKINKNVEEYFGQRVNMVQINEENLPHGEPIVDPKLDQDIVFGEEALTKNWDTLRQSKVVRAGRIRESTNRLLEGVREGVLDGDIHVDIENEVRRMDLLVNSALGVSQKFVERVGGMEEALQGDEELISQIIALNTLNTS